MKNNKYEMYIKRFDEKWASKEVDSLFIQEISDRLYGPDSESYITAIKELNKTHRKREGRVGSEFFDPEIANKRKIKERELINRFNK